MGRFCPLLVTGVVTHSGGQANLDPNEAQPNPGEQIASGLNSLIDFERSEKAYTAEAGSRAFKQFLFHVTDCNQNVNGQNFSGAMFPQVVVN